MTAAAPPEIRIDALDPDAMALWRTVAKIARALGDGESMRWCLVGGLMVALYVIEAGQIARPTTDIDILSDARQRPGGTAWVTARLQDALDATRHEIAGLDAKKGFRFEVDGQVVDVLAPDGLARPAKTSGQLHTIQVPGGSQALARIERIVIVVDDLRAVLHRPTLLAAVLLKARSLRVHSQPEDQRQDLIALLGLMTDPRGSALEMKPSERKWLRTIETALDLDDPDLDARIDPLSLRIARAAYRRLIA